MKEYRDLVKRVDTLCGAIQKRHRRAIVCKKGCDSCCILQSVFPVEAEALYHALKRRKAIPTTTIRSRCVLLADNACSAYTVRPVICRTHGLPIWVNGKVDFCPKNFKGVKTLDGKSLIGLDNLNLALAAVNHRYLQEGKGLFKGERVELKAILGKVQSERRLKAASARPKKRKPSPISLKA